LSEPTHKDIDNIIRWLVNRVYAKAGGAIPKEDLIQEGWVAAIKAQNNYDSTKSKLTTWIVCNVWGSLMAVLHEQFSQTRKLVFVENAIEYDSNMSSDEHDERLLTCLWITEDILSPIAKKLVDLQKDYFLRRRDCVRVMRKADVCKSLNVSSRELIGLYEEIRQGITLVSGFIL